MKGRHKIHDLWSSNVYRVLRAPESGGAVYTIAPVNDLRKIRHVHCAMLKARRGVEPSKDLQDEHPPHPGPVQDEEPIEGVWVEVTGARHLHQSADVSPLPMHLPSTVVMASAPRLIDPVPEPSLPSTLVVPLSPGLAIGAWLTAVPIEHQSDHEVAVRRTTRSIAGQHSNVHHLPRVAQSLNTGAAEL